MGLQLLSYSGLWTVFACFWAGMAGCFLFMGWNTRRLQKTKLKKTREGFLANSPDKYDWFQVLSKGLVEKVLRFCYRRSLLVSLKPQNALFIRGLWEKGNKAFFEQVKVAGLGSVLSAQGFYQARALLALGFLAIGMMLGAMVSNELVIVCGGLGLVVGWRMPLWALKQESKMRKEDLEDHLSEMLEVVSLGVRSGLSFDHSFELYHLHFKTNLAQGCALAQQQWQLGLRTREEALRSLAKTYDSTLFTRIVENIIRSLRFGTALADGFDSAALEARMIHKAQREEEVAKAPVKMLVPTTALILPAMLLLVLGPILLDMMQGF